MEVHTIHFTHIDSTNTWAKKHAHEFDRKKLTCITADIQTKGQGRLGRKWVSKKGNLHMTLVFALDPTSPELMNLAQILAYSCAKVLKQEIEVEIKWPNDLLSGERKLCGILAETIHLDKDLLVIIGLGLNVNSPVKTDQKTTSLIELTKREWDLSHLRDQIIDRFQKDLSKGFSFLKKDFTSLLAYRGKHIVVHSQNKEIRGIFDSITDQGLLNIKLNDGTIIQIASGNIDKLQTLPKFRL